MSVVDQALADGLFDAAVYKVVPADMNAVVRLVQDSGAGTKAQAPKTPAVGVEQSEGGVSVRTKRSRQQASAGGEAAGVRRAAKRAHTSSPHTQASGTGSDAEGSDSGEVVSPAVTALKNGAGQQQARPAAKYHPVPCAL